jgi:hypothetical protein
MTDPDSPLVFAKATAARGLRPEARQAHQAILRHFADTGVRPAAATIADAVILAELEAADLVLLDQSGEIRAAYPFSPSPTAHQVHIADGPTAYAMCAIDALGISTMLGRPTTITSDEPDSDRVIIVNTNGPDATWHPDTALVYAATTGGRTTAADTTCRHINFFTTADTALSWAHLHPEITGTLRTQSEAITAGIAEFGAFLHADPYGCGCCQDVTVTRVP